ncbi:MAG: hypothetical protein LBU33_01170 [Endomicrobium sp.]|jgi:hypothetical protein|nr:hypothetical protein [Endomicrobium sp.]
MASVKLKKLRYLKLLDSLVETVKVILERLKKLERIDERLKGKINSTVKSLKLNGLPCGICHCRFMKRSVAAGFVVYP